MFYSHTILARKSALGTVWIAAHLESKLRKSQVASTDIEKSVKSIMYPEVPIALRLSGHLLLGIVRIYSRKVDYLHQECKSVWIQVNHVFAADRVNLPEDARRAPVQAVTLPETYELDAVDIDDISNLPDGPDNHVKPIKEITLPDQAPFDGVAYISIFLDEDNENPTPPSKRLRIGDVPTEDDTLPPFSNEMAIEISPEGRRDDNLRGAGNGNHVIPEVSPDFGVMRNADNHAESSRGFGIMDEGYNIELSPGLGGMHHARNNMNLSPPDFGFMGVAGNRMSEGLDTGVMRGPGLNPEVSPDFGVMRDAGNIFGHDHIPELLLPEENILFQQENLRRSKRRKTGPSLTEEHPPLLNPGVSPLLPHRNPSASVSLDAPDFPDLGISLGGSSIGLELPPSPPVNVPLPVVRARRAPRKKNLVFDAETIVLFNDEIRGQLKDCSDIVRSKEQKEARQLPSTRLDLWKSRCRMQKEKVFQEPLLSGFSDKLQKVFCNNYSFARIELPHPVPEAMNTARIELPRPVPEAMNTARVELPHPVPEAMNIHIHEPSALEGCSTEAFAGLGIHSPFEHAINNENLLVEGLSPTDVPSTEDGRHFSVEDGRDDENNNADSRTETSSFIDVYSSIEKTRSDAHVGEWTESSRGTPFTTESATPVCPSYTDTLSIQESTTASTVTPWTANTDTTNSVLHQFGTSLGRIDERPEFDLNFSEQPSSRCPTPDDLNFLEGEATPFRLSKETRELSTGLKKKTIQLSERSRAVEKYLKECSPGTSMGHTSARHPGNLSLNKILEGKTRSQCARMFYETLVLKSCDIIDVKQDEPYSDIIITIKT